MDVEEGEKGERKGLGHRRIRRVIRRIQKRMW